MDAGSGQAGQQFPLVSRESFLPRSFVLGRADSQFLASFSFTAMLRYAVEGEAWLAHTSRVMTIRD